MQKPTPWSRWCHYSSYNHFQMKTYTTFFIVGLLLSISSCSLSQWDSQPGTIKDAWYYDSLREECQSGTWDVSSCIQDVEYGEENRYRKPDALKCPENMEIDPFGFDWCWPLVFTLSENTRDYGSGFSISQTLEKTDILYSDNRIYTIDHIDFARQSNTAGDDLYNSYGQCSLLSNWERTNDPINRSIFIQSLRDDQIKRCTREYIYKSFWYNFFENTGASISLWDNMWIYETDTQKLHAIPYISGWLWWDIFRSKQYIFFIGSSSVSLFSKDWNYLGIVYFEGDFNPTMTIDTGSWDDMREDRYLYAKPIKLVEKDDGNIDITFKNGKWEEVIQKIILNGDFPPYQQKSQIITEASEIGKWVPAKELEEWEQNERVPLPVAHCDISWNCVAGNPPDKNSLEKFEVQFPHHDALAYFRDKAGFYSLSYRKNNDRPSFNVLKKIPDLIVVDGYIFEYDSKNILAFGWIPLSDAKNIQIRDDFLIDSKNVWNDSIRLATFDQVKDADPKTFRPLTNVGGDWSEWEYMIDKNHCYWFGWDKENDNGVAYHIIINCNPSKLKYLGWDQATDWVYRFSGWIMISSWTNLLQSLYR